ncbi:MAG: hypothetical protein ACLFRV_08335 [Acidimicrobiales bacterium]
MAAQLDDVPMPLLDTREDYVEYLEAESAGAEPTGARLRTNLVKSYVIETVREGNGMPNAAATFAESAGLKLTELDDGAIYTLAAEDGIVAVIEGAETRFPVIHSTRKTQTIDPLVRSTILSSPWLDHVWLPGRFFDALWNWTRDTVDPGRLAKLKFSYTGKYERLGLRGPADDEALELDEEEPADDDGIISEVRQSQFEVSDRVGVLDERLAEMRELYNPLQSTVQIRIPSTVRGGHEVYNYGKITNRSVSFSEQQKIVRLVSDLYRRVTEDAEEKLWYSADQEVSGDGAGFTGRPVYLSFPERLELSTLHWWADRTFEIKRNIFRLGGQPMWSGPDQTRLHVYGVDRHLWQPLSIEVTRDHMLAVLPEGTCGNTINRLVTNVQRYLSPSVRAWVGEFPYEELLLGPNEGVA